MLTPTRVLNQFSHPTLPEARIHRGEPSDYDRFARFHYRAGRPATCETVLLACIDQEPAAILIVSRPVLNAVWRRAAWPGEYDTPSRTDNATRINRDIRTISRVVVDPRFRCRGLASRLVRAYLADPRTHRTEAVAAIGDVCPFFERAGMTRVPGVRSRRDQKLLDHIERMDETPASLLCERQRTRLRPAILAWARDSRATRRIRDEARLARLAACALVVPPVAYTHDAGAR